MILIDLARYVDFTSDDEGKRIVKRAMEMCLRSCHPGFQVRYLFWHPLKT